jgi:hypothetical protein
MTNHYVAWGNEAKVQHWRAFPAIFARNGAPMLDFSVQPGAWGDVAALPWRMSICEADRDDSLHA